jgi:hypothetical protein
MPDDFTHDVFLSHSSKDEAVVRAVAERLRADGLRVWLDDLEIRPGNKIRPGNSIPARIAEGAGALPGAGLSRRSTRETADALPVGECGKGSRRLAYFCFPPGATRQPSQPGNLRFW